MAKLSLIILTVCLIAATVDLSLAATCTCTSGTTGSACDYLNTYLTCLKGVGSTCSSIEQTFATAAIETTNAALKTFGCSGVAGLISSLSIVLTLSGLSYLFNKK